LSLLVPGRWAVPQLPAGVGDVIVGLTAPAVAVAVVGWSRWAYYAWTFFGIADLVVAVTLDVLNSNMNWGKDESERPCGARLPGGPHLVFW
jgi:hypothetical protein